MNQFCNFNPSNIMADQADSKDKPNIPNDLVGLNLSDDRVQRIVNLRKTAQFIKDSIDIELIMSMSDFVKIFRTALVRAEREKTLDKVPKFP